MYFTTIYSIESKHVICLFYSRPTASEGNTEEEKQRQDEGSLGAPSPLVHGRISSDESEGEGPEEPVEFPSSAAHPRPLAVSSLYLGLTMGKEHQGIPAKTISCFSCTADMFESWPDFDDILELLKLAFSIF